MELALAVGLIWTERLQSSLPLFGIAFLYRQSYSTQTPLQQTTVKFICRLIQNDANVATHSDVTADARSRDMYFLQVNSFVGAFHDAVILYALALNETLEAGLDATNGTEITRRMWNRTFEGICVSDRRSSYSRYFYPSCH